ncbi:hypothetical protein Ga0466249_002392 [Sporomusaceae bacterium BoRhaA]|uniref:clostripain-related cysteine peptidase n=1 Tax=Pelorhabdus rhamnosifermentans TaxID=2772457 RepID=UPI001C0618F9|nr:clostripain-related cysteine peptidase [Pelorhabdus rhamnosifermentans]MBU2701278.1 hypothetical protein [Pelorhabdus rhamnosifermentans]
MTALINTRSRAEKWTVLLYFAGNNDLAPELSRQLQLIQNVEIPEDIHIGIQFGKAPKEDDSDDWGGVRRYISKNGALVLTDAFTYINMGKPLSFIEFLMWGYTQFDTERLMLVMSGHSAGFAGIMMEYYRETLDLISIQDFTQGLAYFHQQTGKNIDILLFDTCYMNTIEVWYELALTSGHPIEYLLLPQNSPIEGLPCHALIDLLTKNEKENFSVEDTAKNITLSFSQKFSNDYAVFAVSLDKAHFLTLKELINSLANLMIDNNLFDRLPSLYAKPSALISLYDLVRQLKACFSAENACCSELENILAQLVLSPKLSEFQQHRNIGPCLYLPNDPAQYFKFQTYYDELAFARNNRWLEVLRRKRG